MQNELTVSVLDELYESLVLDVINMAQKVIENHKMALTCLLENEKQLALTVYEQDEIINQLEDQLNQKIVLAIAKFQPVATDLRKLIGTMKLISDIERIGDYAKNMAKVVIINKKEFVLDKKDVELLVEMHENFISLFTNAIEAFKALDEKAVYEIVKIDEHINALLEKALAKQLSELDDQASLEYYLLYINLLRKIERAGDHTKNICELVVYICSGTRIEF